MDVPPEIVIPDTGNDIPSVDDYIQDAPTNQPASTTTSTSGSTAKTIGMIAAAGAAVGAAALGAHTYMKVKDNNSIGEDEYKDDDSDDEY